MPTRLLSSREDIQQTNNIKNQIIENIIRTMKKKYMVL